MTLEEAIMRFRQTAIEKRDSAEPTHKDGPLDGQMDTAMAFIAAINRRSPASTSHLMTDDRTFVDSGGRIETGRRKMITGWNESFRMFPDLSTQVDTILSGGGVVAVFGSCSATYDGKRGDVPENRIEMPAAWRAVVRDGKVQRWQVDADWTEGAKIIAEDEAAG